MFFRRGSTINDLENKISKQWDRAYRQHAETNYPRIPKLRKRQYLSDQQFMSGMVLKVFTLKPKKPTSGNRKVAKVRLRNGQVRLGL